MTGHQGNAGRAASVITLARAAALMLLISAAPAVAGSSVEPLFVTAGSSPGARVGAFVAGIGDVDGDGVADLLVGNPDTLSVFSGSTGRLLYTIFAVLPGDFEEASVLAVPDLDGDGVGDFVLGAPRVRLNGQRNAGVLYLFSGAWGYSLRALAGPGPQPGQEFGAALALLGDLDGDGVPEIAVGAPGARTATATEAGSVSILSIARGRTLHVFRTAIGGARLGAALAPVAGGASNGRIDLAVGAPGMDADQAPAGGRVLLYSPMTGERLATLHGTRPGGRFGAAIAAAGDLDGDGVTDLLVGAPGYAGGDAESAGEAWVLSPYDGRRLLHLSGPEGSAGFGAVVAAGGDGDGDGRPDLLVGAPGASVEGRPGAGLARLYSGADGRLLLSLSGAAGDAVGAALAFAGDLNGDGRDDVLVGAPFYDLLTVPDVGAAMAIALSP